MGRASCVICFNCGGNGHVSTGYTNPPLTYIEQRKIRDDFRIEREAQLANNGDPGANMNCPTATPNVNECSESTCVKDRKLGGGFGTGLRRHRTHCGRD